MGVSILVRKAVFLCVALLACLQSTCACEASETAKSARIVFIGDIMAHDRQLEAADRGGVYDFSPQFRRILPLFYDALVVGNLETVFAGEDALYTGYPEFNTPDSLAGALVEAGVRIVTLANNHIFDRRERGAARTVEVLNRAGLKWTGIAAGDVGRGEPLIVPYDGLKIAFVNFTYGSNNPPSKRAADLGVYLNVISDDAVLESLARARSASPDLTVACFHWGNEYQLYPTAANKKLADLCLKNGADMIIGTHPHVLQPIEVSDDGAHPALVAWSLGNFVSFQRTLPRERSVVLAVDVEKTSGGGARIARVSVAPTWVSARHQSGRRKIEVVYAGTGGPFQHTGLPAGELKKARAAGGLALDFLGADTTPDDMGFYTIWSAAAPDVMPLPRRSTPH